HRPAGDFAGDLAVLERRVTVPCDALAGELEARQLALQAFLLLPDERVRADEASRLVELDDPAQPRLERGVLLVHVVAVEAVRHLQSKRVARPQAAGDHALVEQRVPELARSLGWHEYLEPVL